MIVDDATGNPSCSATDRADFPVGADGVYNIPSLPRGVKLTIIASGYARRAGGSPPSHSHTASVPAGSRFGRLYRILEG